MSQGIIGVNIMVALSDFDDLVQMAVDERVDLIFLGDGLPLKNLPTPSDDARKSSTRTVPIKSLVKTAKTIFQYWSNKYQQVSSAVVVESPLAGGHLGFKKDDIINNPDFS